MHRDRCTRTPSHPNPNPNPLTHWFSHTHIYFITHPHTPIYTPFNAHTLTRVSPLNSSRTLSHTHILIYTHFQNTSSHTLTNPHTHPHTPALTVMPPFLHVAPHNPLHTHRPTQPSHVYTPHTLTNVPPTPRYTPSHPRVHPPLPTILHTQPCTHTSSRTHVPFSQTVTTGLHATAPFSPSSG